MVRLERIHEEHEEVGKVMLDVDPMVYDKCERNEDDSAKMVIEALQDADDAAKMVFDASKMVAERGDGYQVGEVSSKTPQHGTVLGPSRDEFGLKELRAAVDVTDAATYPEKGHGEVV